MSKACNAHKSNNPGLANKTKFQKNGEKSQQLSMEQIWKMILQCIYEFVNDVDKI